MQHCTLGSLQPQVRATRTTGRLQLTRRPRSCIHGRCRVGFTAAVVWAPPL